MPSIDAGAYFVISSMGVSILIFSSTNLIIKKYPMAAALYKPNMVIYYDIGGALTDNIGSNINVRSKTSGEFAKMIDFLQKQTTYGKVYVLPHTTAPAVLVSKCHEAYKHSRCSIAWFKKEVAFINKKLKEFMMSTPGNPFTLKQAIKNIERSM